MHITKGTSKTKTEVLSPVGSEETLIAAVRAGADAVYLGLCDFNARRNADNFTDEQLADAVKYCHIRGVKVYLTLNTLLSDDELTAAFYAARTAYRAGVDAVIVQDLGLARLLHTYLPELPLHASTQMTVHSPSALPFLKELGFTRVVVSREMSRDELREFCKKAREYSISVEVFVHGALCMCMSGQCLLSAMLGGRSGNRGLCAGPCRLPFSVKNGTGYDLSLKDLSLVEFIDELEGMGVESLKIEGRMKRPEYVAAATAVCRKTVDKEPCEELKETLYKIFSRNGFTSGYFENKLGSNMFGIRTRDDVMMSAGVIKSLHELYRNERQSVPLTASFSMKEENKPCSLTLSDGENTVTVTGANAELAKNRAADQEYLSSQLKKTGGTPYYIENLSLNFGEGLMLSAGALNALRREALESLSELRYSERVCESEPKFSTLHHEKAHKTLAQFYDLSSIPSDLSSLDGIIVPLEEQFETLSLDIPMYVSVPRGINSEEYIKNRLAVAKEKGISDAFCGNIAAAELCKAAGVDIYFDYSMNIYNSESAHFAAEIGAKACILSAEAKCDMINSIKSPIPTGFIAYGRLPLMLTRNCPNKNGGGCEKCKKNSVITDRKGISFPLYCRAGFTELLNSRPIYLAERLSEFSADYRILLFTTETREECQRVIDSYKNGLKPDGDYTRGLYYRGVE